MSQFKQAASGPLVGIKIVELGGIGPGPFCCMLLSDLGAEIIRIDRLAAGEGGLPVEPRFNVMHRGRRSIALDLKQPEAIAVVKRLIARADAMIEGFRPGVTERLGLGPEDCWAINPRLVYGRMTGWGQSGPLAQAPGHDINYIALTGALHAIGHRNGPPEIPLNLVGDFGGGALYLAVGLLAALLEAKASGKGQVVDAGMIDGATSLMTLMYGALAAGYWVDERGSNRLDSGAPFYSVYETRDGKFVALGSNEASFYRATLAVLGLRAEDLPDQHDKSKWPEVKEKFARIFKTKTRDEWCQLMEGKDVCFAPVLSMKEAPNHPHQKARGNFIEIDGVIQPAPAPRFSRTQPAVQRGVAAPGEHTAEVLRDWGLSEAEIADLRQAEAIKA